MSDLEAEEGLVKTLQDCMEAGYCKQFTHEDCMKYPIIKNCKLSGWCAERKTTKKQITIFDKQGK
jgi:hypothetical protein